MDDRGAAFWDRRYASRDAVWSGEPNDQLIAEVSALAPGRAFEAGAGEGADAVWLAERGWTVMATDISGVALARAQAVPLAADVAQRITWQQMDMRMQAPDAVYDLATAHFMQLHRSERDAAFRNLAAAVRPGGTLLVVAHHPSDLATTVSRPPMPELYYTPDDVAAALDPLRWTIIVAEARPRVVSDRSGSEVTVHDTILHARRRNDST